MIVLSVPTNLVEKTSSSRAEAQAKAEVILNRYSNATDSYTDFAECTESVNCNLLFSFGAV